MPATRTRLVSATRTRLAPMIRSRLVSATRSRLAPTAAVLIVPLAVLATACGGGGGGDDGVASINQLSAPTIAGAVIRGIGMSTDAAGMVPAALPDPPGPAQAPLRDDPPEYATRAAFGPNTEDCAVSGEVTFSGDVDDPATYTAGDVVETFFDLCDEGALGSFDGLLENTITSFSGDIAAAFAAVFDLVVTDLAATIDGDSFVLDGDGTVDIDAMDPDVTDVLMSGGVLRIEADGQVVTLRDYTSGLTMDASVDPPDYTITGDGRSTGSDFPGEVSYLVTQPFLGQAGSYPDSGELEITGASNATVWLTAVNSTDVDLEIDLNGDGSVDALIETTWDAL